MAQARLGLQNQISLTDAHVDCYSPIIPNPPTAPRCQVRHRLLGFPYTPTCFPGLPQLTIKLQLLTQTSQHFPQMLALSSLYTFINVILFCFLLLIKSCVPPEGISTMLPSLNTSGLIQQKYLLNETGEIFYSNFRLL